MLTPKAIRLLATYFGLRAQAVLRKLGVTQHNTQQIIGQIEVIAAYLAEFIQTKDEEDQQYIAPLVQLFNMTTDVAGRLLATLKQKNWVEAEKLYIQLSKLTSNTLSMVDQVNETDPRILSDEHGRNVGEPITQATMAIRAAVSNEYDQSGAAQANANLRRISPNLYQEEEPDVEEPYQEQSDQSYQPEYVSEVPEDSQEEPEGGFQEEVDSGTKKQQGPKLKMRVLSPEDREDINRSRRQKYEDRKRQDPAFLEGENNRKRVYENDLRSAIQTMRADPTVNLKLPDWIFKKNSPEAYAKNLQRQKNRQEAHKRMKFFNMSQELVDALRSKNPALHEEAVRSRIALKLAKEKDPQTFALLEKMAKDWQDKLDYVKRWKQQKKQKPTV